jgi:hypothetical protein
LVYCPDEDVVEYWDGDRRLVELADLRVTAAEWVVVSNFV